MGEIRIELGDEGDGNVELDEVDVGVADDAIAFDVSGRIVGLDEATLGDLTGTRLVPTELRLEPRSDPSE